MNSHNINSVQTLNRSDVGQRLKKISKEMNNLVGATKKKKQTEEEIDWDEKVGDDDIRYVIACDMAADMLREEF
jgi:peroxiredoxin family protein